MRRMAFVLATAAALPVHAQSDTENAVETARAGRQVDYQAVGVSMGGFRFYPLMGLGAFHTSNVFRTAANTQSDTYVLLSPGFELISDWTRHQLKLSGGADIRLYSDLTSENRTDWRARIDGRIDVTRPLRIMLSAGHDVRHEERGAPDAPGNAAEPTEVAESSARVAVDYRNGRYGLKGEAAFSHFAWGTTKLIGLPDRSNDDRDRNEVGGALTALYEFSPGYAAFVRAGALSRDYVQDFDRDGVSRDLSQVGADAGVEFEMTTLLIGELTLGYRQYTFDDDVFQDIDSVNYGAALRWYPTELTTVRLNVSRALEPSTLIGVSGVLTTTYQARLEHELLRNLIINASAAITREEFEGSVRDDDTTRVGLEARYFLNRTATLSATADYVDRTSTFPSAAYDETVFGVNAGLKF